MLVHQIDYWVPKRKKEKKEEKRKFRVGSDEHRQYIFDRNLETVNNDKTYEQGKIFRARGYKGIGVLIDVAQDVSLAEWEGLKVKFIEVWFDEEENSFMFHQSDLKAV